MVHANRRWFVLIDGETRKGVNSKLGGKCWNHKDLDKQSQN